MLLLRVQEILTAQSDKEKDRLSCIFAKRHRMDSLTVILVCIIVVFIGIFVAFVLMRDKKNGQKSDTDENMDSSTRTMRLQAYERLTLLVDRIALPNLISRVNQNGVSAREMQLLLTKGLKEEFDYNITQQIYVSPRSRLRVKHISAG